MGHPDHRSPYPVILKRLRERSKKPKWKDVPQTYSPSLDCSDHASGLLTSSIAFNCCLDQCKGKWNKQAEDEPDIDHLGVRSWRQLLYLTCENSCVHHITWQYGVQEFWRFFLYCIGFSIFCIVFVSHIFPIPFLYNLSFCPTSYILYILLFCIILLGYIHSFVTFSFNWSSHWIYLSCVMY